MIDRWCKCGALALRLEGRKGSGHGSGQGQAEKGVDVMFLQRWVGPGPGFPALSCFALAGFPMSQLAKGQFCRTLGGGDSWTVYGAGTPYSVCAPGRATRLLRASILLHLPNVEKSRTHAACLEGSWGQCWEGDQFSSVLWFQSKCSHTPTSKSQHTPGSEHLPHRVRGQSRQACVCAWAVRKWTDTDP